MGHKKVQFLALLLQCSAFFKKGTFPFSLTWEKKLYLSCVSRSISSTKTMERRPQSWFCSLNSLLFRAITWWKYSNLCNLILDPNKILLHYMYSTYDKEQMAYYRYRKEDTVVLYQNFLYFLKVSKENWMTSANPICH